jgi:hypothetical protein
MPDVNTGLIDFLLHPPLGAMGMHLDYYGPYSGNVELTTWSSTAGPIYTAHSVSNTFGVIVQLNGSIPAGWGFQLGWTDTLALYSEDVYEEQLLQLVVQHQLVTGTWVTTESLSIHTFPKLVMWDIALPGRIGLYVAPGLAFDLFYLLVN